MRGRIFLIIALVLSFLLGGFIESYAAQARAYASVLIIIPPREEEKNANSSAKPEEVNFPQNQAQTPEETQNE